MVSESQWVHKYLNPNLLTVATIRQPTTSALAACARALILCHLTHNMPLPTAAPTLPGVKRATDPSVNIYLIDGVTGAVLHKVFHRGGEGPIHVVSRSELSAC